MPDSKLKQSDPAGNRQYSKLEYWNSRYQHEKSFEWCSDFDSFKEYFFEYVPDKASRILILGCGNSSLGLDLFHNGYQNVVNTDYSGVLIERMKKEYPILVWQVADINDLESIYPDGTFDVVLEKATLDSFFVEEKDPWHYSHNILQQMENILYQVSRLLTPAGKFISVSFTQPHFRKAIYAKPEFGWSFKYMEYGEFFHYFFYVMTKGEKLMDTHRDEEIMLSDGKRNLKPSEIIEPLSEDEDDFIFAIQPV